MLDARLALAFVLGALSGAAAERCDSNRHDGPVLRNDAQDAAPPPPPEWDAEILLPPPPPPPQPEPSVPIDPCDACIAHASSGNLVRAASSSSKCTDAAKKKQCQA